MAVAYESKFGVTTSLSATPYNLTLPSGTADGELLLIHFLQVGSVDAQDVFNVSGGTLLEKGEYDNSSGYHTAGLWYKYATSTDISNGYIVVNGSDTYGISIRINVYRVSGSIASFDSSAANINADATPEYGIGLTPANNSSLYFIFASGTSGVSGSGYAVATDNPTWTEITDEQITNLGGTDDPVILGAWATRSAVTATGNVSLTFNSSTDSYGILVIVNPVVSVTVTIDSPGVLSLTQGGEITFTLDNIFTLDSAGIITLSTPEPSIETEQNAEWTNDSKPSTTWTND